MSPPNLLVVLFVCVFAGAAFAAGGKDVLLKADFQTDPAQAGWLTGADGKAEFDGQWTRADAAEGRCLLVRRGHWQSPLLPVTPFEYYRLTFRAKTRSDGYWTAEFFGADGNQLAADNYDSLPSGEAWQTHERCFRANADAAAVRVRFIARRSAVAIDDVRVAKAARPAVAEWADRLYAALPPLHYSPPPDRWKLLPRTLARLREGPSLRVVLLGDSIANDTSHSAFDVLLERAYPKCRVEVVNSVRGGTGCPYYKLDGRVKPYVLAYRPDLLVIAGISHGYDAESIREVIRQVRAGSDCEVMVLRGAICPRERCETGFIEAAGLPMDEACRAIEQYPSRLAAMAAEEKAEVLDTRAAWDAYVAALPHPQAWLMRDPIHANVRGKLIVGRIIVEYFRPPGR